MELWDAYTREGRRTGETLVRGEPVPKGCYHMVCEIILRHEDGTYLAMKRDPRKLSYPDHYEGTAGGAAQKGESPLDCAMRELREETGIEGQNFRQVGFGIYGQGLVYSFFCTTDAPKDSVTLQEGETVDYKWLDEAALQAFMASDECVPPAVIRLKKLLDNQIIP